MHIPLLNYIKFEVLKDSIVKISLRYLYIKLRSAFLFDIFTNQELLVNLEFLIFEFDHYFHCILNFLKFLKQWKKEQ